MGPSLGQTIHHQYTPPPTDGTYDRKWNKSCDPRGWLVPFQIILVQVALCRRCLTAVGHYFCYFFSLFSPPYLKPQKGSRPLLVRAPLCRRCLTAVGHYFCYFGPSVTVQTVADRRQQATIGPSVAVQTVSDSRRPLFLLQFSCCCYCCSCCPRT